MTNPNETPGGAAEAEAPDHTRETLPAAVVLTRVPGGVPDLDAPMHEAAAVEAEKFELPLRMRIPLNLYSTERARYEAWPAVAFTLELRDGAEAVALRQELEGFLREFAARRSSR